MISFTGDMSDALSTLEPDRNGVCRPETDDAFTTAQDIFTDVRHFPTAICMLLTTCRDVIPSETIVHILLSDILLSLSILSAKHWLLARGVGSLWLSTNVLGGAGLGALVYLVLIKGKIAVRGNIPVCIGVVFYNDGIC